MRFLESLPKETLKALQDITLRDVSVSITPSINSLSSLRSLDLAYATCRAQDLWQILAANAGTLEDLSLRYVVNYSLEPLFGGIIPDVTLRRLKSFKIKGIQLIDAGGISSLLGGCPELKRISIDILSSPSALAWSKVLLDLADLKYPPRSMESIIFSAPMASAEVWKSLCAFLMRSGQNIKSLYISANAAERVTAPFPSCLRNCLLSEMPQQTHLDRLVIIWPVGMDLDPRSVGNLSLTFSQITVLHICLPFPAVDYISTLLGVIKPFENLREIHFIFPVDGNGLLQNTEFDDIYTQEEVTRMMRDNLARNSITLINSFASRANVSHFSWSLYERSRNRSPIVFAKVGT